MKKLIVFLIMVMLTVFGCGHKDRPMTPPPSAVAPAGNTVPAAATNTAEPAKKEPTPGTFASKKAAGPAAEEKPTSFAKKTAKSKSPAAASDTGTKKSFAKKKAQ